MIVVICLLLSNCIGSEKEVKYKYYPNGNIKSEYEVIKGDIKNGYYKVFDSSGKVLKIFTLHNGKLSGIAKYFSSEGKVEVEEMWLNDKKHGLTKFYNEEGNLEGIETWRNGFKNGETKYFYPNGYVNEIEYYKNDTLYRRIIYAPDDSGLILREYWKTLISTESDSIQAGEMFRAKFNLLNSNNFKDLKIKAAVVPAELRENLNPQRVWIPGVKYTEFSYNSDFIFEKKIDSPGIYYLSGAIIYNETSGRSAWSEFHHRFVVYAQSWRK